MALLRLWLADIAHAEPNQPPQYGERGKGGNNIPNQSPSPAARDAGAAPVVLDVRGLGARRPRFPFPVAGVVVVVGCVVAGVAADVVDVVVAAVAVADVVDVAAVDAAAADCVAAVGDYVVAADAPAAAAAPATHKPSDSPHRSYAPDYSESSRAAPTASPRCSPPQRPSQAAASGYHTSAAPAAAAAARYAATAAGGGTTPAAPAGEPYPHRRRRDTHHRHQPSHGSPAATTS